MNRALPLALLLLTSCTEPRVAPDPVRIVALDGSFRVGAAVRTGWTRITFANEGRLFHMLGLRRLADGKTFQDLDLVLGNGTPDDDDTVFAEGRVDGAPGVLTPGGTTTTYADLRAGTYALVCYFPDVDNKPFYTKGMLASLQVIGDATAADPPESDGEITTDDATLRLPDLGDGDGTFRYVNTGTSPHALTFVRLHDGRTYADFVAWLDGYFRGELALDQRPVDVLGGLEATAKEAYVDLALPPGRYLAVDTATPDGQAGHEFFRDDYGGLRAEFTVG